MGKEHIIQEALALPVAAIEYHVSQYLAEKFPEKALVEGSDGFFNVEAYAQAGHCSLEPQTFLHNQIVTHWYGREIDSEFPSLVARILSHTNTTSGLPSLGELEMRDTTTQNREGTHTAEVLVHSPQGVSDDVVQFVMTNYIDLHTHSTASDGIYAPAELLRRASEVGLRVLALTDHDTTDGVREAAEAARKLDIDFIPGLELNTDTAGGEVHVLGYFPEFERPAFQQVLKTLRDARERRGQRMVELLNEHGIAVSWERVREIAQGAVGRPHVAKALMEAGYVGSIGEAFDKYIGNGCRAYVPRYRLSPVQAVRLIDSANGLPVIAHPLDLPGLEQLRTWLPELCAAGMVGLETYYGPYTEESERLLHALADEYHLIPTGGTDFHGPGIHPTPLGGRYVPRDAVERLKAEAAKRQGRTPPNFELPPPVQEK